MTNFDKQQITSALATYCARFDSQNKAANSLRGVSSATISQMLNENWDLIKDEMWKNVAAQIGYSAEQWAAVDTRDFRLLNTLLADARTNSNVFAATGDAGTGKSFALRTFAKENKRVYLLSCNDFWTRKMFLQELLATMGHDNSGYTMGELMAEVVSNLKKQDNPLIIMDEADKLSDQVLYFFLTLYNQLEDHCGIVMAATSHLEERIKRGIRLGRKGYAEIYSRIGRKYIKLKGVGSNDVRAICNANGITDASVVKEIFQDCEGDLRRVKRLIHANKQSRNNAE